MKLRRKKASPEVYAQEKGPERIALPGLVAHLVSLPHMVKIV